MVEKIGNVTLDLEYYPGEDFYCDGDIEDHILDIVKNNAPSEYDKIIEENNNWPVLYHLSKLRGNIVDWFPISKDAKVLEVGSGCGAITGTLSSKCREITCIDLSKKRSTINAYRNQNADNITIKVGNFQDIEPSLDTDYDVICLIGVFEYGAAYINSKSPYTEFLNILLKHVKKGGRIVIAIENRFGLKYFAGCMEDHLGQYFTGIEDYPNGGVVRTFTRKGLEKIFKECGVEEYSFFYPYPDYKFCHTIYSDKRLPLEGELSSNLRNFDRDRMLLFDEKNAYDSIIRDGEFPLFANSYFAVIGPDSDVVYSKFSNDRDEIYSIRTDIVSNNGELSVIKCPKTTAAKSHIQKMSSDFEKLSKRYDGSGLTITPCNMLDDNATFPYLKGDTLENILDNLLNQGDMEEFEALLCDYYEKISYNSTFEVSDYDLIFPNILIDEDKWQVIDYEWTVDEAVEPVDILKRALYTYSLGGEKRRNLDYESILRRITGDSALEYNFEKLNQDEIKFQKRVTDKKKSLPEMRDSIGYEVLPLANALMRYEQQENEKKAQIYMDYGKGFNEQDSIMIMPETEQKSEDLWHVNSGNEGQKSKNIIKIKLTNNLVNLRFDPSMKPIMVNISSAYIIDDGGNRINYPMNKLITTGASLGGNAYAFGHNDPNMTFAMKYFKKYKVKAGDEFVIEYEVL